MKKYFYSGLVVIAIAGFTFLSSCKKDKSFDNPTVGLSESTVTAHAGEEISVTVTTVAEGGFKNLVITKLWDGTPQGTPQTLTSPMTVPFTYTVIEDDADHVLTFNFTINDNQNKSASTELVVEVELTARQLLLKYNWRLSAEMWKKENTDEISDVYNDDVYRFNADGTYNKSIGAKVDDFSDIWYNYCYYNLNDNTLKLLMSRTGAFGEKVTDTLKITVIDGTKLYADVTYYDLDQLDPKFSAMEAFQKQFVAVAKTASFDPYQAGSDDDTSGPAGYCEDVVFEND